MTKVFEYERMDKDLREKLNFHIQQEFGHIPIVRDTDWAIPDWTIIYFEKNEVAFFYNIVERMVILDGKRIKTCGINNVITVPRFRGQGLASKTLAETEYLIFKKLNNELGVLLCADALIPFYQNLKWYTVDCPVYFKQNDGKKLWPANTMLLSNKIDKVMPKEIDLNGLPW